MVTHFIQEVIHDLEHPVLLDRIECGPDIHLDEVETRPGSYQLRSLSRAEELTASRADDTARA